MKKKKPEKMKFISVRMTPTQIKSVKVRAKDCKMGLSQFVRYQCGFREVEK